MAVAADPCAIGGFGRAVLLATVRLHGRTYTHVFSAELQQEGPAEAMANSKGFLDSPPQNGYGDFSFVHLPVSPPQMPLST